MGQTIYKTFNDLVFESWLERRYDSLSVKEMLILSDTHADAKQAVMSFPNGYDISVLLGGPFYSNGVDTYEVAVIRGDHIVYPFEEDDVFGYQTKEEVTEIMRRVQDL